MSELEEGEELSALSFFRYSFETALRNRKRSLFAVIGIALAMALVSGSFVAVDSSAFGLLRSAISSVEVDFVGEAGNGYMPSHELNFSEASEAVSEMESLQNIEEAMPFVSFSGWTISNFTSTEGYYYNSAYLAFIPNDSTRFLDAHRINGDVPENGTAAVPKQLADSMGLVPGDKVTCSMVQTTGYYNNSNTSGYPVWVQNYTYLNISFTISEIWTQEKTVQDRDYYPGSKDDRSVVLLDRWDTPIVLNLASYPYVFNSTVSGFAEDAYYWPSLSYMIWIDRDKVLNLADIEGTIADLGFIQHRLMVIGDRYGFQVRDSELVDRLNEVAPDLQYQKLLFLGLSLPVVALGVYLSVVGVDLGVNSRRREVGMLKSRGASNRQVFTGLLVESLILGALAAVIGLVLGLMVSRFLVGVAADIGTGSSTDTFATDFRISTSTVELAILFGVGLMLASSYRPFKRVSKTDVAEALHHYSPTTAHDNYKARMDVLLLVVSGISIGSIVLGFDWVSRQNWSWMTRLLVAAIMMVGIAVFPLMPFLLSLSVIRLTTRGPRRLYSKFTLLVKPWTRELHELVDRNIVRNPKRASNLCIIISLALAFGLFISVTMESTISYQRETVKFEVGADMRLEGTISGPEPPSSELSAMEGVAGAARFGSLFMRQQTTQYGSGFYFRAASINVSEYMSVVAPSDFYFAGSSKGIMRDIERQADSILITREFAKSYYILVGDTIRFSIDEPLTTNGSSSRTWTGELTVLGLVKGLPGLQDCQAFIGEGKISWIPRDNFTKCVSSAGAFIDVKRGGNVTSITSSALMLASQWNWSPSVTTLQERLDELEGEVAYATLSDFLYTEYAMAIAIMSVGVGLIIFVAVTDRQQELACIMARGASGSQMRKLLMGESVSLMALGLVVGAGVGTLTAYLFNTLTQPGFEGVVPHKMVFTYVTWIIVAVSVVSLLVASLLATSRAGKIKLAEVLRIRGG